MHILGLLSLGTILGILAAILTYGAGFGFWLAVLAYLATGLGVVVLCVLGMLAAELREADRAGPALGDRKVAEGH
jgi:hypothetical protein